MDDVTRQRLMEEYDISPDRTKYAHLFFGGPCPKCGAELVMWKLFTCEACLERDSGMTEEDVFRMFGLNPATDNDAETLRKIRTIWSLFSGR